MTSLTPEPRMMPLFEGIPYIAQTFTKKPVNIQAFQLTETFFEGIKLRANDDTMSGLFAKIGKYTIVFYPYGDPMDLVPYAIVETLEDVSTKEKHRASLNDWIIIGVEGEIYPVKDRIFKQTYELTEQENEKV